MLPALHHVDFGSVEACCKTVNFLEELALMIYLSKETLETHLLLLISAD